MLFNWILVTVGFFLGPDRTDKLADLLSGRLYNSIVYLDNNRKALEARIKTLEDKNNNMFDIEQKILDSAASVNNAAGILVSAAAQLSLAFASLQAKVDLLTKQAQDPNPTPVETIPNTDDEFAFLDKATGALNDAVAPLKALADSMVQSVTKPDIDANVIDAQHNQGTGDVAPTILGGPTGGGNPPPADAIPPVTESTMPPAVIDAPPVEVPAEPVAPQEAASQPSNVDSGATGGQVGTGETVPGVPEPTGDMGSVADPGPTGSIDVPISDPGPASEQTATGGDGTVASGDVNSPVAAVDNGDWLNDTPTPVVVDPTLPVIPDSVFTETPVQDTTVDEFMAPIQPEATAPTSTEVVQPTAAPTDPMDEFWKEAETKPEGTN